MLAGRGIDVCYESIRRWVLWSEAMDADSFEAFEEAGGPFDEVMAGSLEKFILSVGGSDDAEVLYTAFRGRMPGMDALLKGRGLMANT
jgi:peptidyl-dipeptidase Dcp